MRRLKRVRQKSEIKGALLNENYVCFFAEYSENTALIPKNTSLTIARIPLANQVKKAWDPGTDNNSNNVRPSSEAEGTHVDLSRMNGSEEDKINAMMMQSTMDYDPNK